MARGKERAQRVAIITIMLLFVLTSVGGVVLSLMQAKDSQKQQEELQELLTQQNKTKSEAEPSKKAKDAYIPKGEVTKLEITDIKTGTGDAVKAGDTVTVDYQGTLTDGTIFDSSYEGGEPATFGLDQVIEGWQKGIPGMKVGGKRRLVIPADLAYGAQAKGTIPANSALVFEIELKSIGGGE